MNSGVNTINLAVRFLMELFALWSVGQWAYRFNDNWTKYIWAIGFPLICAVIWGLFNVAGDPSRSGNAPVPVPGIVRLAIELAIFALACYALNATGHRMLSVGFAILTFLHYIVSYDRVLWLLKQ